MADVENTRRKTARCASPKSFAPARRRRPISTPERSQISPRDGSVVDGEFVDGGVSPFNDPALQLLMLAALQGHGFHWPTGKDQAPDHLDRARSLQARPQRRRTPSTNSRRPSKASRALQSLMDDCAANEPGHAAMADGLSDALDHRPGRRRHEARQPERSAACDLRPL